MRKGKLLLIAGITAAFMSVANDNVNGQTLASNGPAKTEVGAKTKAPKAHLVKHVLDAPVIKKHQGDYAAMKGSRGGNIAVHIYHAKGDPISGERYAKGMAKGFASPEKTGNKPIYITATYEDNCDDIPKSYVNVYIDGVTWKYNGNDNLSPQLAGKLAPQIMQDYVDEFGYGNIITEEQSPSITATL